MEVFRYMKRVPDFAAFPSVDAMHAELDELAAAHPGLVTLRGIGASRLGEPLRALTVGDGPRDAVIVGGPDPNEPIGALTVSTLIRLLCEDAGLRSAMGLRWHFVPCADPDGARLNEGWYATPGDRRAYAEHFYRPGLDERVDWGFPLPGFDRTPPETAALMRLMDELRPSFVSSLHNGEYTGAFYYLNRDDPGLAARLTELPTLEGIPLHLGEPELPGARPIAPAVYLTPDDAVVARLTGSGGSSAGYAATFGASHLVSELPYWADDRVADQSPAGVPYREVLGAGLAAQRELFDILEAAMEAVTGDLVVPSPYRRSTESSLAAFRGIAAEWEALPGLDRPATVAEVFGNRQLTHLLRLRLAGVFLRMLDAELAAGNPTPAVRERRQSLGDLFERWFAEAEADSPGRPIEIRKLVAVQLGAILLAGAAA